MTEYAHICTMYMYAYLFITLIKYPTSMGATQALLKQDEAYSLQETRNTKKTMHRILSRLNLGCK